MNPTLQSITPDLMVEDVEKTIDFYKQVLKFNVEMSVPSDEGHLQWAMLTRDNAEIMFQEKSSLVEELPELDEVPIGGTFTLFIRMEGIDTYYDEVKDKVEIIKEPMVTFYGMKEFTIRDLNGYIITFAEPQEE